MEQQFGFGKESEEEDTTNSGTIPGVPTEKPQQAKQTTQQQAKEPEPTQTDTGQGTGGDTAPVDEGLIIEFLEWFIEGGYGTAKHREVAQTIIDVTKGERTTDIILDNWMELIGLSLDPSPDIVEIPLGVTIKAIFEYFPEFLWRSGKAIAFAAAVGWEGLQTKGTGAPAEMPTWDEFKPDTENSPNWNAYLEYVDAVVDNIVEPFTVYMVSNTVWAVHARRKRNALYAAFGSDSEFMKQQKAKKMTPLEMKQFIDKQGRAYKGGLFYGFGKIAEKQIEKEMQALEASKIELATKNLKEMWDAMKEALKDPKAAAKAGLKRGALGTLKTAFTIPLIASRTPMGRGIYGKIAFLSILKGLGTERQDIYIDMLNANVRGTLDAREIQLLDAEIERLQAANTDGSKSQRDIVFEAIEGGKFGDKSSSSQRAKLIKAIQETDSQTLTRYRKNVNNFVRQFMTSLSKKIPEVSRLLARNTGEFIENFKKGYVYNNDPLVKAALEARKNGQAQVWTGLYRKVPGTNLRKKIMFSVDDVLDGQRVSLGMAAADEAKLAQRAAKATVNFKNVLGMAIGRLKGAFREQRQLTEAKSFGFEAFADFAKSEQEKLDKEEKQANERFNKAFDVEGKEEEFEPIFQDMLKNEVDKIADSEELNSIIDSVFEEIEKEFNTTRQQLSQRLNSIPATPEDGEQDTQPQTRVDVDGSDDPVVIQGKVPPQSPINETKYTVSKQDLIDVITENLQDQFTLVEVDKDQLINHITEEAYKAISRKK